MDEKDSNLEKAHTNRVIILPRLGIFSIANQLRYGFPLLVILGLLITAGGLIYLAFQTQIQQLEVAQRERSRAAAGEINTYLDDLQRKLAYLARVQGLADFPSETQQYLLEGLARHNDAYETIAILDKQGQVTAVVSPDDESVAGNLADSPQFLRAYKQKEDYIGAVDLDPVTRLPEVTLAVPIRDRQDQVAGVLMAEISLKFLWFIVSQTEVGQTGYVYVIDSRNFLIAEKGSNLETFELRDVSTEPFIQNLTSGQLDPLVPYQGLEKQEVLGALAPVRSVRWNVVVELPTAEAYTPIRNMLLVMGIALAITTIIAVGSGVFFSRWIVLPLQRLTEASAQISAGNMDSRVEINSRNEVGILAMAFNQMTGQLGELYVTLEQQVAARTRGLEIVANLGERLVGILNVSQLLAELVQQVKENFGYYHVHVYLLDETGKNLVVAEGSGMAGAEMKARGHSIPLNAPTSLVARAARSGEIVKVDNVRMAEDWLPNPLLPDTYAEMAVPIVLGDEVVGVLDVQESQIAGLDDGDAGLLRSLANQLAVAIGNARLFNEVETALAESNVAQERYTEQSWEKTKVVTRQGRYHYSRPDALRLNETQRQALAEAKDQVLEQSRLATIALQSDDTTAAAVISPVMLRNRPIGTLQIYPASDDQTWTEDDLAVIEAVTEQLAQAAENLRLFEETRERASREQVIREVTDKLRAAPNMDRLLETAARELGQRLGVRHTVLELGIDLTSSPSLPGSEYLSDSNQ